MPIPRLIHQIWLDKADPSFRGYPAKYPTYVQYAQSWQNHNPTYQYQLWNMEDVQALLKQPEYQCYETFFNQGIQRHIEKCDFARYLILHARGGIYADLDFECRRSLDELIAGRELGLVPEVKEHQMFYKDMICNSFLISAPERAEWRLVLDTMMADYIPGGQVAINTGPCLLHRCIPLTPANTLPSCLIIPFTYYNQRSLMCTTQDLENAYCFPHWTEGTCWWLEDVVSFARMLTGLWPVLIIFGLLFLLLFLRN